MIKDLITHTSCLKTNFNIRRLTLQPGTYSLNHIYLYILYYISDGRYQNF